MITYPLQLQSSTTDELLLSETLLVLGSVTSILASPTLVSVVIKVLVVIVLVINAVAESNRSPFDLPEAESELVAGFMTEYSSTPFVFFFLAEYTNILAISTLLFLLFFGISMALPIIFFMLWLRASLARLRFDQLLKLGWGHILPLAIAYLLFLPPFLYTFDILR